MSQQHLTESQKKIQQRSVPRETRPTSTPSWQGGLHPILQLQRMLGNRSVAELIQAKRLTPEGKMIGLQRKLTVGAAGDQYEQEADRVARQVLNTSDAVAANSMQRAMSPEEDEDQMLQTKPLAASITPFMQRQMVSNEESEDKEKPVQAKFLTETSKAPLQRQPENDEEETEPIQAESAGALTESFEAGADVETQVSQSKGHGSPLPDHVRAYMEPRFGVDFSHVHVHTGSDALQMNQAVGAQAFTHGSDIYFGEGHSPTNLELTAHELTHVVQQTGGAQILTHGTPTVPHQESKDAKEERGFNPISSCQDKSFVSAITPLIQTKCATCKHEEELQKKESKNVQLKHLAAKRDEPRQEDEEAMDRRIADSVESRLASSNGGGDSLPENLRTDMESAFGADFSGVKVHTGPSAVQMNQDLGAKAFTHGNNIYLNADYYNPSTSSGRKLLAHELTHVVQQSGGEIQQKSHSDRRISNLHQTSKKDILQLDPNVTGLAGPAEMPAGQGSRVTLRATAAPGTAIAWNFLTAANGAVFGPSTGRTNTLTAPAGSTGGVITVQAANAVDAPDVSPPLNITLVEIQQPTFTVLPPPAVILPAGAAFPLNTVEASVCGNNATAAAVTVPALRPVTWSIVGNRRGAVIDPATGVITPSVTQTGNIVIRATDNVLAAARNQQTLTVRAHPRRINNTVRTGTTAAAGAGAYGSVYDHIFQSSGGALTGVNVSEHVFCGSDPFNFCPGAMPVLPGLPNVWTLTPASRMIGDFMLTGAALPGIDVNRFLPSPPNPGLPQVLTTPQILYWRSEQCGQWIPFQNVPIQFILRRGGAGGFETVTINNKVSAPPEPYTGPALLAGAAPAGSVCGAGEGLSNISFSPSTIAADGSALTTTSATVRVRPGGNLVTWSFPGPNFGANIVAQGNPALFSAGNIAGQVRVRVAMTATPGCFAEGWLRMQEVEIGPAIRFSPSTVRTGGTARATVSTKPGSRIVTWSIIAPVLGAAIVGNPDNSATITAGAQVGRITVRATDQRDVTRFADASLVIN